MDGIGSISLEKLRFRTDIKEEIMRVFSLEGVSIHRGSPSNGCIGRVNVTEQAGAAQL